MITRLALLGALLLAAGAARAQYAAPGFPMLPHRRPLPPADAPVLRSPVLPRFWHETNPDKQLAGRTRFFDFVMAQAHFPDAARPAPDQPAALLPTGRLYVSIQVRPNGSVRQPPRVLRRELARPPTHYPPPPHQAHDNQALRVLGALRFARSPAAQDSLVVPMRFITQ